MNECRTLSRLLNIIILICLFPIHIKSSVGNTCLFELVFGIQSVSQSVRNYYKFSITHFCTITLFPPTSMCEFQSINPTRVLGMLLTLSIPSRTTRRS